jgi:excinuclease ABC subunit C
MIAQPALREYVRTHAENRPGVYRMADETGQILYVGKSIRVRTRLLSYFRAPPGQKAGELIRSTRTILWDYHPNEFSALLTEMRQIKNWRPKYNVEHNRKRDYTFAKLTVEPAPRIVPVTRVVEDGSEYFGPFPAKGRTFETLNELSRVLGLRDCPADTPIFFGDQLEVFNTGRTPLCMRAELGTCLAPCAGRVAAHEYMARVDAARTFLMGRGEKTLRELEAQMARYADRMEFEYAAVLRDRVNRLRRLQEGIVGLRGRVKTRSFLYRVPGYRGANRVYLIRDGRIAMDLPDPIGRKRKEATARRLTAVMDRPSDLKRGLTPREAAEVVLVARWFRLHPGEKKRTVPVRTWLSELEKTRAATPAA